MTKLNLISQQKMRQYLELKDMVEEFEIVKKELIELALKGYKCQRGPLTLKISKSKGVRRPKWKDAAIDLAGRLKLDVKEWEKSIIDATTPGEPSYSISIFDADKPISD